MQALPIDVTVLGCLTDETLYRLSVANRDARFERTKDGELIVMSPTGGETGIRNSLINAALVQWNEHSAPEAGFTFDSNAGFLLPNGAMRAPDAAWVARERWERLSSEERRKFPPLCPDFVVELISESDYMPVPKKKMIEWIENGCRLGWLIDPFTEQAFIYRPDGSVETVSSFGEQLAGDPVLEQLAGDPVLPDFTLALDRLR